MKHLTISNNSAIDAACIAAASRVFFGIVIDSPELMQSGWISVILGGLIALPVYICIDQMRKRLATGIFDQVEIPILQKLLALVFIANALLDGGISARCISSSASYVAFNHAIRFYLLLPLFLAVLWALHCNGDAIGASAKPWKYVFFALTAIVVVARLSQYRWTWLMPILGPGGTSVLNGAVDTAGWLSGFAGLILISGADSHSKQRSVLVIPIAAVAIAAVLIILHHMMAPVLLSSDGKSRMFQLDFMLSNGRAPLLLQFPLIVIWFVSLVNLLVYDCFTVAVYFQVLFPKLKPLVCTLGSVVITTALTMSYLTDRTGENLFSSCQFIINSIAVTAIAVQIYIKRGKQLCEKAA